MWGIGSLAVKQFAAEFGENRTYTVLPYSSNLSGFLALRRRKTNRKSLRFLFSGSLIYRKGFDLLLNAFEKLIEDGVDAELFIVGNGPLESAASRLINSCRNRIKVFGFIQPASLPEIYGECDVLCAPSRHDGWGLIVVEGMAAGMPVISTSATGAAVDLIDKTCGWLIPPGDQTALYTALRAAEGVGVDERLTMGFRGRERTHEFDRNSGATRFIAAAMGALELPKCVRDHAPAPHRT
jgi:glycosyltransferase involved in cell wall biosynthesis